MSRLEAPRRKHWPRSPDGPAGIEMATLWQLDPPVRDVAGVHGGLGVLFLGLTALYHCTRAFVRPPWSVRWSAIVSARLRLFAVAAPGLEGQVADELLALLRPADRAGRR